MFRNANKQAKIHKTKKQSGPSRLYYFQAALISLDDPFKNWIFFKAQATEAFSPQKRTSSTSKHENSLLFSVFVGHFALLDLDPTTQINADPEPQPCL